MYHLAAMHSITDGQIEDQQMDTDRQMTSSCHMIG